MINPDKYLRKYYKAQLADLGIPVFNKRVPVDIAIPLEYVIISTQTKTTTNTTKCGREFDCTVLLDVISKQPKGLADFAKVDDYEQTISDKLAKFGVVDYTPIRIMNSEITMSDTDDMETDTETIVRKLIRLRHIVRDL